MYARGRIGAVLLAVSVTVGLGLAPAGADESSTKIGKPAAPDEVNAAVVGDIDDDGILDVTDNCDVTFNSLQGDADLDGLGNACDPDFGEQDLVGGTIYENRLCQAITLPANDDGSSQESEKVFFPTPLRFFGAEQRFAYANNNGNITFVNPLSTFTPFEINADTPPMIAPFFADVDTRGIGGGKVTYGVALNAPAFGGRNVSCFTWEHVGYFSQHQEKKNTFQLLIVERSDIAPGDFDIYFNYARLDWETGDASGGTSGLGGSSAGAGFSSGTGLSDGFFSMPCTLQNGQCIDANTSGGLRATSTNSTIRGRHVFRVRGGASTFAGSVAGTVELNDPPQITQPTVNTLVELCQALGGGEFGNCRSTFTVADGSFDITNVGPGDYRLRAFPQRIGGRNQAPRTIRDGFQPSAVGIDPLPVTVAVNGLGDGERRVVALETTSGTPPPSGVTFGRLRHGGFFPHIIAGRPTTFTVQSVCGVNGTYEIRRDGQSIATGVLTSIGLGRYQATVTLDSPGLIDVRVSFPGCTEFRFDAYIDPSGFVVDQDGNPIAGATVTLVRSDFPEGPFTVVESGSEIMSPSNRVNPDVTESDGFFGWDTLSGFYRVDATADGCTAGSTPVLPVPPEQVDLQIVLTCGQAAASPPLGGVGTSVTFLPAPGGATGALAFTGQNVRPLVVVALGLILLGAVLVLGTRRRRTPTDPSRSSEVPVGCGGVTSSMQPATRMRA